MKAGGSDCACVVLRTFPQISLISYWGHSESLDYRRSLEQVDTNNYHVQVLLDMIEEKIASIMSLGIIIPL